jgi:MSHA biogenesis protein MshP
LTLRRNRGMALLPALFVLVFVASLIAFAVSVGTTQRQTVNFGLLGDRALAAANAGIEWGRARARPPINSCNPLPVTFPFTETGLRGFRVQVICVQVNPSDGSGPIYNIEALAQWNTFGSAEYVSRRVRRQF